MSAYKKEIVKAATTILLVGLLTIASYYLFPESVHLTFAGFAWAIGENSPTESEYNVLLRRAFFKMNFFFANGTVLSIPNLWPEFEIELDPDLNPDAQITGPTEYSIPEYHGEIDASSLIAIGTRFIQYGVKRPGDAVAIINTTENRYVNVHLVFEGADVAMGTHEYLNDERNIWFNQTHTRSGGEARYTTVTNTGYFLERFMINVPTWKITLNDLYPMLPNTGTATIEFHTTIEIDIPHYNVTVTGGDPKTGSEELSWDGILGTYQLTIDDGKIISVKYDFVSVFLFLKIAK